MLAVSRNTAFSMLVLFLVAACATGPRSVPSGVTEAGKLRVTLDDGWYRTPADETPGKRASTRVLSKEGIENDRLYLVGGIDSGETLLKSEFAGGATPFVAGMSADDIARFVAGSLEAASWGGSKTIEVKNVTQRGFTGIPGIQFELEATGAGTLDQRGLAGAFTVEDRLYAVVFLAAVPDSYDRHREAAQQAIDTAIVTIKTIRRP